jgi:N-methylhydantoinase A
MRLAAIGEIVKPSLDELAYRQRASREGKVEKGVRRVFLRGNYLECPVYDRERLSVSACVMGPAIIEQVDSTSLIFPGQTAEVDRFLNLIVSLE